MAVTAVIAAVAGAAVSGVQSHQSRRDAKKEARRQENAQEDMQRRAREEEERVQSQRSMIANRMRQRALSSWNSGNQSLGNQSSQGTKDLLGL